MKIKMILIPIFLCMAGSVGCSSKSEMNINPIDMENLAIL